MLQYFLPMSPDLNVKGQDPFNLQWKETQVVDAKTCNSAR